MIGALHMPHNILPVFLATEYENWHLKCSLCPQLRRVSALSCFNSSKQTKQMSVSVFAAMTNQITVLYLEWAKIPKILILCKKVPHLVNICALCLKVKLAAAWNLISIWRSQASLEHGIYGICSLGSILNQFFFLNMIRNGFRTL